jgi:hypothetical protein
MLQACKNKGWKYRFVFWIKPAVEYNCLGLELQQWLSTLWCDVHQKLTGIQINVLFPPSGLKSKTIQHPESGSTFFWNCWISMGLCIRS